VNPLAGLHLLLRAREPLAGAVDGVDAVMNPLECDPHD
jgi:hypothetical protein